MSDEKSNLVKKLCSVMEAVPYIQKRGYNKFHDYHYALEADVSDAIRKRLVELNVLFLPSLEETVQREVTTKKGNTETVTRTRILYRFVDGDSGEELEGHMEGEGQDPGDKGIYKAITGTIKYVLMKVFLIPTGDDPEADEGVDEQNADRQQSKASAEAPQDLTELIQKAPAGPTKGPLYDTREQGDSGDEESPFGDEVYKAYPNLIFPPPGTKGISALRVCAGHAQLLGYTEEQFTGWHKGIIKGKELKDINAAQAVLLREKIKKLHKKE